MDKKVVFIDYMDVIKNYSLNNFQWSNEERWKPQVLEVFNKSKNKADFLITMNFFRSFIFKYCSLEKEDLIEFLKKIGEYEEKAEFMIVFDSIASLGLPKENDYLKEILENDQLSNDYLVFLFSIPSFKKRTFLIKNHPNWKGFSEAIVSSIQNE